RRAWVLRQSALDESARKDDTLARSVLGDNIIDRAEKILEALPTMGLDFQATAESVAVAEQIIDLIREAEETHNDRSGAEQDQPDAGADEGSDSGGSSDSEEEDAPEKAGGQGQRNPSKSEEPWANEPLPDTDLGDLLENDGHLEAGPGRGRSSAGQTFSFASRSRLVAYPEHMRQEIAQEASALAGGIRRSLRALLEGQDRNRRDPRRQGRLDTRSLASVMTGNRRAFYREEFARAQSSAVHILLDVSGSMMAVESARGYSLMRESLIATHAMMEALEPLSKVRSAVSVFPNESQNEVWCPVPFSETFSGVKRKQASSLYPAGGGTSTPMFQSLRAVAGNLLAQPEERKIAIVVTDGAPDFTGETPSKVVDDVRNCGVSVFGVGLGVDLSNVFGEQYVSVEKLEALSGELKKAARNLLR
ncbi:VWA domain-containing protein, partial [Thioalkalivibrio sp. ALgr3]|uniref:VWA domain-containing protein n=1 Tax=Thioalkalivibrio sp. ALgr3 TaxID=1239292 RepID=UPI000379ABF8